MEFKLIPLGSGPQGPGQFRMILKKLQATSGKLQATSNKRLTAAGACDSNRIIKEK